MQLDSYFDQALQEQFKQQIPTLRGSLGRRPAGDWGRTFGVGGNTYRALGGYIQAPSYVYQDWAKRQLAKINGQFLEQKAGSRADFLAWHSSLIASMDRHWTKAMNDSLSFAHTRKLVDLFVKWVSHYDFGTSRATDLLVLHANCALDRQTLTKLNACLSGALPIHKPSMGDVSCQSAYSFCQDAIHEFASSCGGTRLLFDCFGWTRGG